MNNKLRKIINHYGLKKQLKYFQTEIFELTEAILKWQEFNPICEINNTLGTAFSLGIFKNQEIEDIKEEIADVMVMLKQFQLYYNISSKEVKEVMNTKINRQLKRIKKENQIESAIPVIEPIDFDNASIIVLDSEGLRFGLKGCSSIKIVRNGIEIKEVNK